MKNISDIDFGALSEEERAAVLQIMNEIADKGSSDKYTDILYQDYKEIPVDIITFIKDPRYLGKAWHLSDGECKLYPYWEDKLRDLFPDNISTSVNNFILSGARGLGKSEIAVTVMAYLMYRVMCLKNPLEYFGLKPTERIAFSFMNITEALAYDIGVSKFQNTIQMSPWFMERGTLSGTKNVEYIPNKNIRFMVGSTLQHTLGVNIIWAALDEVNFKNGKNISMEQSKIFEMYSIILERISSRYLVNGRPAGMMFLASSKQSQYDFLENYIQKKVEENKR